MTQLFEQIVGGIGACAEKGMYGMGLTMEIPETLDAYFPHIIGDLRGGGLHVDVIAYHPGKQGNIISLFLTW